VYEFSQMVLGNDFYCKMVLQHFDVGMPFYNVYKPSLDFITGLVFMM
jgi:hypothetical protein